MTTLDEAVVEDMGTAMCGHRVEAATICDECHRCETCCICYADDDLIYCPIFEQDGNRFFIAHKDFMGRSPEEAMQIGIGSMIEQVAFGFKWTHNHLVMRKSSPCIPHVSTTLGPCQVAVISGPLFDGINQYG